MSANTTTGTNAATDQANCVAPNLKLKGGLFPLTLLELVYYDAAWLKEQLQKKIDEAPQFFKQAPVILSTEHYQHDSNGINLNEVRNLCAEYGLMLVALRSNDTSLQQQAKTLGMGLIATSRKKEKTADKNVSSEQSTDHSSNAKDNDDIDSKADHNLINQKQERHYTSSTLKASSSPIRFSNTIVRTPIRSGQQVYANGGDLIVMAPVSAGAEILADGSIHVYGPMRGRALAGVQGDTSARVFCQSLEAELISIAGHFTTQEDSQSQYWKQAVHIFLSDDQLCIERLPSQPR